MIAWRAFFADRSVYESTETSYADLPREGMVGVVEYESRPYRRIIQGADWYWMGSGLWHSKPTGEWGEWKPEPDCCDPIRSTSRIPDAEYEAIYQAMLDAPHMSE